MGYRFEFDAANKIRICDVFLVHGGAYVLSANFIEHKRQHTCLFPGGSGQPLTRDG